MVDKLSFQRSVQAIAAEAHKRLHLQNVQNQSSSFNSSATSKGRSPGERSSPSATSDRGPVGDSGQLPGGSGPDANNQQDWTFEEQFKQVSFHSSLRLQNLLRLTTCHSRKSLELSPRKYLEYGVILVIIVFSNSFVDFPVRFWSKPCEYI